MYFYQMLGDKELKIPNLIGPPKREQKEDLKLFVDPIDYMKYLNSEVCSEVEQNITVECMSDKCVSLMNELKIFSLKVEYKPGCIEHIGRRIDVEIVSKTIINNQYKQYFIDQKIACIKEKELNSDYSSCEIIADVELKNICLFVKSDYVCVDYEMLIKNGKINELSEFLHFVLLCKITAGTVIYCSPIFTLVKRCEAENINLEFQDENSIKFFDCLRFSKCRSTSKVDLNLYCMTIKSKLSMGIENNPNVQNTFNSNNYALENIQNEFIALSNMGSFIISKSDIKPNTSFIRKIMNNKKIKAYIKLKVFWSFHLTSNRDYILNIHTDINGVISWTPMICKITYKGLKLNEISESTGKVENKDIEIPFSVFDGPMIIQDYCKGYESRSCYVFLKSNIEKMPCKIVGQNQYLAALAGTDNRVKKLCKMINDCRTSFLKWNFK